MKDVENSQLGLQDIRVFGAYFNSNDELLLTENAVDMLQKTKRQFNDSHHVILTLINDYVTENAPSVQRIARFCIDYCRIPQQGKSILEIFCGLWNNIK